MRQGGGGGGWGQPWPGSLFFPSPATERVGKGGQEEKKEVRDKVECSGWGEGVKGRRKITDSKEVQGVEERKKK